MGATWTRGPNAARQRRRYLRQLGSPESRRLERAAERRHFGDRPVNPRDKVAVWLLMGSIRRLTGRGECVRFIRTAVRPRWGLRIAAKLAGADVERHDADAEPTHPPWATFSPDHLPVEDLTPTVAHERAHVLLTAAPPTTPAFASLAGVAA
jgi:hypothetical protein